MLMKLLYVIVFSLFLGMHSIGQTYQPNWESLDLRPTPQWFRDGKFGIFIHWGVYAVPGWSTKGNYAEWYQYGLQTTDSARKKFHAAKFGNRSYYDLANDFKAELWNPDEWANLFERSGAKYIVLTSKHHDGFTLWPSRQANETWGFKWNAVEVGPKRDIISDLFTAVRKTSVRAGMYYSLYEWFNPLWKKDPKKFAMEHTWPQMKDLINNYQPDVFWTDGDWDQPAETWQSQQFLAWLYNESPVKEKIVVNDRWGTGIRFKHGGIYTPEYQPDLDFEDHYWEESRGMGYSYGYNREEDAWDYNSSQSLVLQLIDKVSRGGNFLLDIGPDEHGKIPPIMQERLLDIGGWLKMNGEAIYNTTRWKISSQWGEGKRDYKGKTNDLLLKLTVDPDPGYAVKEFFYTYNKEKNNLYAIFPSYPTSKKLQLRDLTLPPGTIVRLLTGNSQLNWSQSGSNVTINLPDYNPGVHKFPFAYVLKIENFGKFPGKPNIKVDYDRQGLMPIIQLNADPGVELRYTIDGTEPGINSTLYSKPFSITNTSILKVKGFKEGLLSSPVSTEEVKVYQWLKSFKPVNPQPGLSYQYYEPEGKIDMSVLDQNNKPVKTGISTDLSIDQKNRIDKFAFLFSGYLNISQDGIYYFYLSSDDGSRLFIDDVEIVNNDGDHGTVEKMGKAALRKGFHRLTVKYFDSGGGNQLSLGYHLQGSKKQKIPGALFYH